LEQCMKHKFYPKQKAHYRLTASQTGLHIF
jgi:hypothetical protein